MAANVCILTGPARSGKTAALLARYRRVLAESPPGSGLWLTPNKYAAREIRERLLRAEGGDGRLVGCFSPGVYTFQQFAQMVLAQTDGPQRFVGGLLKRQLIERVLGAALAAGRLEHFAPIADRPGLVDLVANLISDLKRQEVSPAQFAASISATTDSTRKNREVAELYGDYQRLLDEHHLYDAEGRFSAACDLLKTLPKASWGPFAALTCVVADGFSDFTATQQEILQLLGRHVGELTIALPLEQQSGRGDLFHKPNQTLSALQKRFPKGAIEWRAWPSASTWPAMGHIERRLFSNPREIVPCEVAAGVEIVAAASVRAEIEWIARRIKHLILRGDQASGGQPIPAGNIAVAFRTLEAVAPLVQEIFDEYGIPSAIDWAPPLNRAPVLQALVGLLRLQATDWPYRQLLAVLSNNLFQPDWPEWRGAESVGNASLPEAAIATEWAIRQLQIPKARKALLAALERRAKSDDELPISTADGEPSDESDAARQQEQQTRFRTAAAVLNRLAKTLSSLEQQQRTIEQWIAAIDQLVGPQGLLHAAEDDTCSNEAVSHLKTALAAGDQLETKWLGLEPPRLSLDQFLVRLQEILSVEKLPTESDDTGRVRVLSAQSVRAIAVPYLFAAGLSEKSFPSPGRDDRIYSDAEFRTLNKAGLRFADQHDRACDEMLLFYEVITRATKRLVLSYPALDAAAQPLLESPYLVELDRACGEGRIQRSREITLSPVPQHEHPCSPTERRLKAVAELLGDEPQRLASLLRSRREDENILAGLRSIAARSHRENFGPFEGILAGDATQKLLAKRYGPEHCWSVSRLEEYAYCPFRFFSANVLGLVPLPELSLEMDYGRRGQLAHEALATLHRRLNEAGARRSPAEVGAVECGKLSDGTLAVLLESVSKGSPLEVALRTIDFRLIGEWMQQYFGQHEKYDEAANITDEALRPAHFEVSFGLKRRRREEVDPISTEKPFELQVGDETVRLSGRIDRIDIGLMGGQVVFNILDYKTGGRKCLKAADFAAGLALQLPLYALAVQELLMIDRRAVPWRVGYWYLKEKGFDSHSLPQFFEQSGEGLQETEDWRALRGTLLERVMSLARGIRGGMFAVFSLDDDCTSRCPYNTVCRIGQIRSLAKPWPQKQAEA